MTRRSLLPLAEALLLGVSLATVAGMWRLFEDGSFFWPLAGHAVAAHLVAAACRRQGLSAGVSGAVVAVAAVFILTWSHLGATTALGLPTGETLDAARDRLDEAWRLFDEVKAPAPVLPGFLLAAGAALWAGAFLADLAAFRLWTSFEALIPSGTVFVFASLFAADRGRAASAALWLAAALAFVLAHRTARQHDSPSWVGSDPDVGSRSLLRTGAALLAVAVAVAAFVGPNLPGAGAEALVAVTDLDDGGGGSRLTISPLVEIRGRLVEQSQVELFTVHATQRAYWRLTALDEFDGEVWSSRGSFGDADGPLDDVAEPLPGAVEITQEIAISGLAAIWLPAAFEPVRIDPGAADVRWEAESSTLIVSTEHPTSDGLLYSVASSVGTSLTAEQLTGTQPPPEEVVAAATGLPTSLPATVAAEAERVVTEAGAVTPFERAMALQAYFRGGTFIYSLDAPAGHSGSAIESFLFVTRTGYCEQFAGTYAAMARAVGLPARVAVGFTPGIRDPNDPNLYRVRGEHAHAWPEVWIPGAGWLAFEPTPGRGQPFVEYDGVEEAQDTEGPSTDATTVPTTVVPTASSVPPSGAPTTTPTPLTDTTEPDPLSGTPGADDGPPVGRWLLWALLAIVVAVVVVVLAGAAVASFRLVRRWRRHAAARTAEARVRAAWADAVDAVGVVGLVPRRWETPVEFARRAGLDIGEPALVELAEAIEEVDYAAEGVGDEVAARSAAAAAALRRAVRSQTSTAAHVLAVADPRPPDRRTRRRGPRPSGPRIRISGR